MAQLSTKFAADAKVDGLTFQFLKTQNAKVAIQADIPWALEAASASGIKVLYYEVKVAQLEGSSNVAVGIATANFPVVDSLPGKTQHSYGFHGQEGLLFTESSPPAQYGSSFGQGDIIGVGVDTSSGELFFTKNGAAIGAATIVEKSHVYFPTVGTEAKSTLQFDFDGPFVFKGNNDIPFIPNVKHPEEKKGKEVVPQVIPPQPAAQEKPKAAKGHIMISYQWGSKEFALMIYEALTARRFVVWMDVKGGMTGDIYQSMAEGVEGAVVFVPLITSKYTASPNCRRECSAAADKRKKIIPLMCENINITGWLLACISGLLWTECFDHKVSKDNLDNFLSEVEKAIPENSPARQPNLAIYISYSLKDRDSAEIIRKLLEEKKPPFNCIMSTEERSGGNPTTPQENKKDGGMLQKSAALEEKLTNAKAVILILSNNFETTDHCKNDISLSYSHRKQIIPILVKKLKAQYPPKGMEFALRDLPYLDVITMIQKPEKHSTISRRLTEALTSGAVSKPVTSEKNENFLIKNVGKWTEDDVTHWLKYVELAQYAGVFKAKHVDGKVLLGLHEKDFDSLGVMKLHQRRFSSAISSLFNGLNWNEDEVAEWMDTVGLSELTQNLYKAHINGQSLLMLTESDLTANDITDVVTQKRILAEIQRLKETEARVPIKDELYRFKILRPVLKPVPSDTKDDAFKFSKETLELLKHIYQCCEDQTKSEGLTQVALKKFLFTLLVVAGLYNDAYPAKNIWNDINIVELLSLKNLATGMMDDLDELLTQFAMLKLLTEEKAGPVADYIKNNKIFGILSMNYLILENIIQRLFAIIDRQVDGVISWNELLPSMELIVHGSTDDKFKLAMCLVDFNGDGDISKDEFIDFYKDCFLPIVNFCKVIKLEDFDRLNKDSFLFVAHQKVKDGMSVGREPTLLNKSFSVKQFRGFLRDRPADSDDIFNVPWDNTPFVWYPYGSHPHELTQRERRYTCDGCSNSNQGDPWNCPACEFDLCSDCYAKKSDDPARNIDILGMYTNGTEFTLTNITFGGKYNCAVQSLVKNALLWISVERPDLGAYDKFNNFTKEQFDAYDESDKPLLFITTDPAANFISQINLEKPVVGKYIFIKLLTTFTEEELHTAEEEKKKKQQENKEGADGASSSQNQQAEGGKGEAKEEAAKEEAAKEEAAKEEAKEEAKEGKGGDDEDENQRQQLEYQGKCIVTEFIGLWGYDGKNVPVREAGAAAPDASNLFQTLVAKYDALGTLAEKKEDDTNTFKINKYVTEFLKAARDVSDGSEELPEGAKKMGIEKKEVQELLNRLSYLTIVGDNPANALILILPILHLFRLFYGHNVFDILTKPM